MFDSHMYHTDPELLLSGLAVSETTPMSSSNYRGAKLVWVLLQVLYLLVLAAR